MQNNDMKILRWNVGIAVVGIGYKIRKHQWKPNFFSLRWAVGAFILKCGYKLRGNVPQKTWKGYHI